MRRQLHRFALDPHFVQIVLIVAFCTGVGGCTGAAPSFTATQPEVLRRRALDLLLRAAQSEDPYVCANAVEALVKVAPEEGLPRFRAAVRSPAPMIRFAGIVAVGTLRDRTSCPTVRQYRNDENEFVRLAAAFADYRCGRTGAAGVLVQALRTDPEERVRAEAAHLIGRLEEPRAIPTLRAAGELEINQKSQQVQITLNGGMARLGDDDAVWWLIDRAEGLAPLTRLLALQTLLELRVEQGRQIYVETLAAKEEYLVHRLLAARALGLLGSDAGYKLAAENLRYAGSPGGDPDEPLRVKTNAAMALGEIGALRALPLLEQMAERETDSRLQVAACYAICRIIAPPANGRVFVE